jgi:hypothetical protein
MVGAEAMQARRAALLVHGLPPNVRRQVFARLGAAESAKLHSLLDELIELGVPPSLGQRVGDLVSPPADPALPAAQRRTRELDAAVVVTCLERCSPMTVAQLLRAHDWPWKNAVFRSMYQPRRQQVLQCLQCAGPALAPGVLQSLCRQLCRQAVALSGSGENAGVSASGLAVGASLGKWFRWTR